MMNNCHILDDSSLGKYTGLENKFTFKLEQIVSASKERIGYEVLLDFNKASKIYGNQIRLIYDNAINDGYVLYYLVDCFLSGKFKSKGIKIFINVERHNLCNKVLLRNLKIASDYLFLENDIELVVEITERNYCGACALIRRGISYLKSNMVSIAADDYDIYDNDFRKVEVDSGIYDYIKINMPTNDKEVMIFNEYSKAKNHKIVLERVEVESMLDGVSLKGVIGLQGYAFP